MANQTNESIEMASFTGADSAEQAVEALHDKGFTSDQIRYSGQYTQENFLQAIKDMLVFPDERQDESQGDIATMVKNMGISQDELQYYMDSFKNGNYVVVVRPDGRNSEVASVFSQYGGGGYSR
jgi:ERCC4-related helicase